MRTWRRDSFIHQAVAFLAVMSLTVSGLANVMDAARILPQGKVSVFDGERKIGELTAEAPFPEGKILKVKGTCGVKMDTFYLIAEDQSTFAVASEKSENYLFVKTGRIHFGISAMPQALVMVTPGGVVTARQAIMTAAAGDGVLKGYVDVSANETKVSVVEGGSLVFTTAEGEKILSPGGSFVLAQAVGGPAVPTSLTGLYMGLGLAALFATAVAVSENQDSGSAVVTPPPPPPPGSPANPQ